MARTCSALVFALWTALLLTSCSHATHQEAALRRPDQLIMHYYQAVRAGDVDKMWALYSTDARAKFTKATHKLVEGIPTAACWASATTWGRSSPRICSA